MRIESGPTGERKVRTLLLLLMVAGFSGWFAYDGLAGYPAENLEEYLSQLPSPEERDQARQGPVYPTVTADALPKVREALAKISRHAQDQALRELFGGDPSYKRSDAWYYFGPTFRIRIDLLDGRPIKADGSPAKRSATDILFQKSLALILALVSVYCLLLLIKVVRTHAVIDDIGLACGGRTITWDQMKALDTSRFAKKGWVDLLYDDAGDEQTMRLDEYHLGAFDEIIDAICARKNFENPLPIRDNKPESPAGTAHT
jgi:hypothetical protein